MPKGIEEACMQRVTFKFLTLFICLMVLVSVSVYGESANLLRVRVPFTFLIGNKTMPAGEYTVEPVEHIKGGLLIRRAEGRESKIFLGQASPARVEPGQGMLVFHRYGDQYFLSQVVGCRDDATYELVPSRKE